jgi:hypothetical protein
MGNRSRNVKGTPIEIIIAPHPIIADQIHTVAVRFNLPVLSVHDSFIVAREHQETLSEIMRVATQEQLGHELKRDVAMLDDLPDRTDGYRSRLTRHQARYPMGETDS